MRIETPRLLLRQWRSDDLEPYADMLKDADTARYISSSKGSRSFTQAWTEVAYYIGHWELLGFGMFAVEHRASRKFIGRVGLYKPPGWPGPELAWAISADQRGNGFAVEAAEAVMAWAWTVLPTEELISIIHPDNRASQRVAAKLGETPTDRTFAPFGEDCELWSIARVR